MRDINLTTEGEGRYLKAYQHYLAGWRENPPPPSDYGVRRERARGLRVEAVQLADAISASDSRFRKIRSKLRVPK